MVMFGMWCAGSVRKGGFRYCLLVWGVSRDGERGLGVGRDVEMVY